VPLEVQLVSPEQLLFQGEADMVVCRTTEGEIAFLPGHVPFLGALATAPVRLVLPGGAQQSLAVHGGFVEVSNDRVAVLSDVAELADQIDVSRAEAARRRAQDALAADPEDHEAAAALARAEVRLEVAGVHA
jgi:F-type H+-transporting ATPase subunit epsilon